MSARRQVREKESAASGWGKPISSCDITEGDSGRQADNGGGDGDTWGTNKEKHAREKRRPWFWGVSIANVGPMEW